MLQAIFAKHVKERDILLLAGGEYVTVESMEHNGSDRVDLITKEQGLVVLREYDLVGLGHRPLPDGTTRGAVLQRVVESAGWLINIVGDIGRPRSIDAHVDELGKVILDYQLCKPIDPVHSQSEPTLVAQPSSGFNADGWH